MDKIRTLLAVSALVASAMGTPKAPSKGSYDQKNAGLEEAVTQEGGSYKTAGVCKIEGACKTGGICKKTTNAANTRTKKPKKEKPNIPVEAAHCPNKLRGFSLHPLPLREGLLTERISEAQIAQRSDTFRRPGHLN